MAEDTILDDVWPHGRIRMIGSIDAMRIEAVARKRGPYRAGNEIRFANIGRTLPIGIEIFPGAVLRPRFEMKCYIQMSDAQLEDYMRYLRANSQAIAPH